MIYMGGDERGEFPCRCLSEDNSIINARNLFNAPDGILFDTTGLSWIQADGSVSDTGYFAGTGTTQTLACDPVSGRIERFLTGPAGSEARGLAGSPDRRAMLVGIRHPPAPFRDGAGRLPHSAVMVVTRDDGALPG